VPGDGYSIRLTSSSATTPRGDTSDAAFTLVDIGITVTSPKAGDVWRPGTQQSIAWTYKGDPGSDVRLELNYNGTYYAHSTIVASTPIGSNGSGSYTWTVQQWYALGPGYTISVWSNPTNAYWDSSDPFVIDQKYNLTVAKAGNGMGRVTSTPSGTIDCGATCAAALSVGSNLTLFATPDPGQTFTGWSDACSGTDPCALTIDGDKAVTATFTAPPTGITLSSPNGGESWSTGTTQAIRWTHTGNPGSFVRIDLLKGGVLSRILASTTPIGAPGSGTFNWFIPVALTPGSDYAVRVTGTTNGAYSDISDTNFRITGPGITVVLPNGGENWQPGTSQTIRWSSTGSVGSFVRVDLYKSGVLHRTLIASTPIGVGGSGSYSWVIPATQAQGADFKVRVTSTASAVYSDMSDANFNISAAGVKVGAPNGGELWRPESTHTISWSYTGAAGTDVRVELLKGGVLDSVLAPAVPIGSGGAGSYIWTVPAEQMHGSAYTVRITSNQTGALTDSSDTQFTIDDLVQLTVAKQGTGAGNVTSSPAGIACGTICSTTFSSGTAVTLTAAAIPGHAFAGWSGACSGTAACTLTMNGDQQVTAAFTAPPSGLTVTSPNGGENLYQGETLDVEWTYLGNPGAAVKIELLKGGVLNRTLSMNAPVGSNGGGSFSWTLPQRQTVGSDYKVRVTSTTDPTYTDSSDLNFSIAVP